MVWEVVISTLYGSGLLSEQERIANQAIAEQRLAYERRRLEMLPYLQAGSESYESLWNSLIGAPRRLRAACNCRNCGAPAEPAVTGACSYCGTELQ